MGFTISIPSFASSTSSVVGPLGSLYTNTNGMEMMQYPRNLGSSERAHAVVFTARKIKPISELGKQIESISGNIVGAAKGGVEGDVAVVTEKVALVGEEAAAVVKKIGSSFKWNKTYNDETTDLVAQIALYMPETLNFQYASQYNEMRLLEAAATIPLVGKIASGIESILDNKAARVLLNRAGYVFNPQQQLLFEGIDFRTFQMAFTFTPVSAQEAAVVKNIIKTFRKYMAPEFIQEAGNMFFRPPAVFDIDFLYNGKTNENINKVTTSVIKDIDVNYAPNGWSAHNDGSPVQTTVTMTFMETALVDRSMIENEGY